MSNNAPLFKLVTQLFASVGVSKVLNDTIVNNTNIQTSADAVKVWCGSIVLGSMLVDSAVKHVDEKVDAVLAWNRNRKVTAQTEQ